MGGATLAEHFGGTRRDLQLREKLEQVPSSQECIFVGGPASNVVRPVLGAAAISLPDGPECLAIARGKIGQRTVLVAAGSDARGLVYALLELADRVRYADDPLAELRAVKPVSERPANGIRSVCAPSSATCRTNPGSMTGTFGSPT